MMSNRYFNPDEVACMGEYSSDENDCDDSSDTDSKDNVFGLSHKFVRFLLLRCLCVLIIFCDTSYVNIHIILIIYAFSKLLSTDFVYSITLLHSLSDGVPS